MPLRDGDMPEHGNAQLPQRWSRGMCGCTCGTRGSRRFRYHNAKNRTRTYDRPIVSVNSYVEISVRSFSETNCRTDTRRYFPVQMECYIGAISFYPSYRI